MRIMSLSTLLLLTLSIGTAFGDDLSYRVEEFSKLQEIILRDCVTEDDKGEIKINKEFRIDVNGEKVSCDDYIAYAKAKEAELNKEVADLRACVDEDQTPLEELAVSTGSIIEKSPACTPSPDAASCTKDFACSALAAINIPVPLASLLKYSGKVTSNAELEQCAGKGENCAASLLRGIFDSLWNSVKMIWDLGKLAVTKTGELLGIVKKAEAATSDKLLAAQQASPGFLKRLKDDPIGTLKKVAADFYESVKIAAQNHYGCEKWDGTPLFSNCIAPLSTWDCASCGQKLQVFCGIGGYAIGEIGVNFLTGGLVGAGKVGVVSSLKLVSPPAKAVAKFIGKTFPKPISKVASGGAKIGALAKTGLTAVQAKSVLAWTKVSTSMSAKLLGRAAEQSAKSSVGKGTIYVGKKVELVLKPVKMYIDASNKAFMLGFNVTEKALTRKSAAKAAALVVSKPVLEGSNIADEALHVSKPTLVPAANQSKVSEGMVLIERDPKRLAELERNLKKATEAADDGVDITKYKVDNEYGSLFKEELYKGYRDDVSAVIATLERKQPGLSKAEIKNTIRKLMDSCDL